MGLGRFLRELAGKDGFKERKEGLSKSPYVHHLDGEAFSLLREILFEAFSDFDRAARANAIFYTLSGGSVLGSLRHGGFIPWDDDIDIMMPRKDFEVLKVVFERELGDKYTLCAPELGRGHGMAVCQMKRRGTVCRSYNELTKEEAGIAVDIFILEDTFNAKLLRDLHGYACLAMGFLLSARKTYEDYPSLRKYLRGNPSLQASFAKKARIGSLLRFIPLDRFSYLTFRVYSLCRNDRSRFVAIPSGRKHFFGELYLRSDMCRARKADFEGRKAPIPYGYETYLKALYGDSYMELPPEEDREQHPVMELDFGDAGRTADGSSLRSGSRAQEKRGRMADGSSPRSGSRAQEKRGSMADGSSLRSGSRAQEKRGKKAVVRSTRSWNRAQALREETAAVGSTRSWKRTQAMRGKTTGWSMNTEGEA